jgi:hypothetical protein
LSTLCERLIHVATATSRHDGQMREKRPRLCRSLESRGESLGEVRVIPAEHQKSFDPPAQASSVRKE